MWQVLVEPSRVLLESHYEVVLSSDVQLCLTAVRDIGARQNCLKRKCLYFVIFIEPHKRVVKGGSPSLAALKDKPCTPI